MFILFLSKSGEKKKYLQQINIMRIMEIAYINHLPGEDFRLPVFQKIFLIVVLAQEYEGKVFQMSPPYML